MRLPWSRNRSPKLINYAEREERRNKGVSGLPIFNDRGEATDDASYYATGTSTPQARGLTGMFESVKSALGTKAGMPYQQAHNAVQDAMALISPWMSNIVWLVNRIFFTLAREAYGGNAVVYASLRLLSTAVAEPPLVPHEIDQQKNRQELDWDHPLYKLVRHPNPIMTEMTFVEMCVVHMGLVGRTHWWKERDNLGRTIAIWPLRPDRVGPLYATQPIMTAGYAPFNEALNNPKNTVTGALPSLQADNRVLAGWTYWPPGWSVPIRIPRKDVMTINLGDPAGETGGVVEGLGPIQVLAREVEADNEATNFVAALLKNSAMPGTILHVKSNLMREKAALFKREFKKAFGGTNRGDIAIFDGDTALTQVGFNMQQLEFPNLRKVSESRIAASLGIPTMLVGFYSGLESANRSTLSEFREYFAETTLPAWWRRIQEQFTKDIAHEFGDHFLVTFDTSKVKALLVQAARTIQPYETAFKEGVITVNEYRTNILGLPPLAGPAGNMLYVPNTSTPVDADATDFDYIGTGVAANYGTDAPDMGNTLQTQSRTRGRQTAPGEKPTATPRLPHSDKPAPDSTETAVPPERLVKNAIMGGTGVCFSCGNPIEGGLKGFRCKTCLSERGIEDGQIIETYTHIGDRGRPWVPDITWKSHRTIYPEAEIVPTDGAPATVAEAPGETPEVTPAATDTVAE